MRALAKGECIGLYSGRRMVMGSIEFCEDCAEFYRSKAEVYFSLGADAACIWALLEAEYWRQKCSG